MNFQLVLKNSKSGGDSNSPQGLLQLKLKMKIPTKQECYELIRENNLPENVIAHCEAVMNVALQIYNQIKERFELNPDIIMAAALLHDIEKLKKNHVMASEEYLKSKGLGYIGEIVGEHGIKNPPKSIYGKIVFYADKIVNEDKIVTLKERLDYIQDKYRLDDQDIEKLHSISKNIEKELEIDINKIK